MNRNYWYLIFLSFFWHTIPSPKFSLITTLSNEKNIQCIQAYLNALEKNLNHELIDDIHIIYDLSKDDEENNLLKELQKKYVTLHYYNGQPSNNFYFHLAHTLCKNKKIIICNPHSCFNETLHQLNSIDLTGKFIPLLSISHDDLQLYSCDRQVINEFRFDYLLKNQKRVSIITSLFKGDEFIADFMKNITQQSLFEDAELIIVNAHSPGNEEAVIMPYLKRYPNIRYIRLPYDPGLYAVWNMMIRYASSSLISNANVDDRRAFYSLENQVETLEKNPHLDLAYSNYCLTQKPNAQWQDLSVYQHTYEIDFAPKEIRLCRPGPMPTWRKSIHDRWGYFREDFISAADHEMWCRIVDKGSKFIRVPGFAGLYYLNPSGASTDPHKNEQRQREGEFIRNTYRHLWANG